MNTEVKVYEYPGGEIQRVQVVRFEDWAELDFLRVTAEAGADPIDSSFSFATSEAGSDTASFTLFIFCPPLLRYTVYFSIVLHKLQEVPQKSQKCPQQQTLPRAIVCYTGSVACLTVKRSEKNCF